VLRLQSLINDGTYNGSPHKEIDMERLDEAYEDFLAVKKPDHKSKYVVAVKKN